jgi:hypothetical protein
MKRNVSLCLVSFFAGLILSTDAFSLVPYEDFSGSYFDEDKWITGEFVREIRAGKLVLKNDAYGLRATNNLNFIEPAPITYIEADVVLDEVEGDFDPSDTSKYAYPSARLTGFFYNNGTGKPESYKGEVQAIIRLAKYRGELILRFRDTVTYLQQRHRGHGEGGSFLSFAERSCVRTRDRLWQAKEPLPL